MHPLLHARRLPAAACAAIAAMLLAAGAAAQSESRPPGTSPQEIEVRPGLSPEESARLLDSMAPTNAASVYYQLFMQFTPDLEITYHYFDGEPHTEEDDAETAELIGITRDQAIEALANAQELINSLMWASNLEECDFGVMYQEGWSALLPHLGKARASARILRADAWRQLEAGRPDAAAARLAAIYNLGRQVSRDRILISSLVGIALNAHANQLASHMIENGSLTNEGRDQLVAALGRFNDDDPFNTRECVKMEGAITIGWLAKEFGDGADAGSRLLAMGMNPDLEPGAAANIRAMGADEVLADARRLAPFYGQALGLWDRADGAEKLDALSAAAAAGAYGQLGKLFAPSLGKARAADGKGQTELFETLSALLAYRAPKPETPPAAPSTD